MSPRPATPDDALTLANALDEAWHAQPRSFEREALSRFWGLLSLAAGVLSPGRPRALLRAATVLRNARFQGAEIREMFFDNQEYTEVDGIFFKVGSTLGHLQGDEAWVVEVERKAAHSQGDYYKAVQRAKKFAHLLGGRFGLQVRPVVIFEDEAGRFSAEPFDGEVLLIPMGTLRRRTQGLRFPGLADLPGVACDKTLVKLALLRQLTAADPHHPGGYRGPMGLARAVEAAGLDLHLPVVGHQRTDALPSSLRDYLLHAREDDAHLQARIERYLSELVQGGALQTLYPAPRLSIAGGDAVLRLLASERTELQ